MSNARVTYQAIWNGAVLAESDQTISVEGNEYFPPEAIRREHFRDSPRRSVCHWKGAARYYSVDVDGKTNADADAEADAAWYYPGASDRTGHSARRALDAEVLRAGRPHHPGAAVPHIGRDLRFSA